MEVSAHSRHRYTANTLQCNPCIMGTPPQKKSHTDFGKILYGDHNCFGTEKRVHMRHALGAPGRGARVAALIWKEAHVVQLI